jgi:hypothetical protein
VHTGVTPTKAHAHHEEGAPDVIDDCASHSPLLKWCEFVAETDVTPVNGKDTPMRSDLAISGPSLRNCESPSENVIYETFSSSASSSTTLENGSKNFGIEAGVITKIKGDISGYDISKKEKTDTGDFTVRVAVPPFSEGRLVFEPYMVEVRGWWNAWYKDKQYGHWNWFVGKETNSAILRIPRVLPGTNLPDGKFYAEVETCSVSLAAGEGKVTRKKRIIPAEIAPSPSR